VCELFNRKPTASAGDLTSAEPGQRIPRSDRLVPSAEEMAPWIDTVIRLWDDATFYEHERRRCLAAAEAWRPERLLPRFEEFFTQVIGADVCS